MIYKTLNKSQRKMEPVYNGMETYVKWEILYGPDENNLADL